MVCFSVARSAATEIGVFNRTRELLGRFQLEVLQLVPPGGQTPLSLTFSPFPKARRKTVYPDLLAIDDRFLYVGELKPRYSKSDAQKLNEIESSPDAFKNLCRLAQARCSGAFPESPVLAPILIHEQETAPIHDNLFQLIFSPQSCRITYGARTTELTPDNCSLSTVMSELILPSRNLAPSEF